MHRPPARLFSTALLRGGAGLLLALVAALQCSFAQIAEVPVEQTGRGVSESDAEKNAAIEVVRRNLSAMQANDVKAALATIHPDSPAYSETPALMREIAQQYQLAYELEKVEVSRASPEEIYVDFVQVTRRISGPETFPDNRVAGTHQLRRADGEWRIWSTTARSAQQLDGTDLPLPGEEAVLHGEEVRPRFSSRIALLIALSVAAGAALVWYFLASFRRRPPEGP